MWPSCNMTQNNTMVVYQRNGQTANLRSCRFRSLSFKPEKCTRCTRKRARKGAGESSPPNFFCSFLPIVFSDTAVFCAVMQCSFLAGRNRRDDPKSGCQGDYLAQYPRKSLALTPFGLKGMERAVTQASTPATLRFRRMVNEIWTGNFRSRIALTICTNQSLLFTNGRKNLKLV